ncbi:hypothetical protein Hanom_Chr14g01246611 [Helianthus anomalus]
MKSTDRIAQLSPRVSDPEEHESNEKHRLMIRRSCTGSRGSDGRRGEIVNGDCCLIGSRTDT